MSRVLNAFIGPHRVGALVELEGGMWSFEYEQNWLDAPDRYALAPGLPLQRDTIVDTGSKRPVQWYFDNLLPEEGARTLLAKDAGVSESDAFALLERCGIEAAGSLTLVPDELAGLKEGLAPLSDKMLAERIARLPRVPLMVGAPKRMSLAGSQQKLAVAVRKGMLFEPIGMTASTHILKPDQAEQMYPHTVINEYFTMRLARTLALDVPAIERRYVPNPVYLVERFDRRIEDKTVTRVHCIDACQLLNIDRRFKYEAATLARLNEIADRCTNKPATRVKLFTWLVFNTLVGNSDAHLKNLSFLVDQYGIRLAPHYDLVATSVYDSKAYYDEGRWPNVGLAWKLDGCNTFADVKEEALLRAGEVLKLSRETAVRIVRQQVKNIGRQASVLLTRIEAKNAELANDALAAVFSGELRLMRAIVRVIINEMTAKLASSAEAKPKRSSKRVSSRKQNRQDR